jgi:hypothetical protein
MTNRPTLAPRWSPPTGSKRTLATRICGYFGRVIRSDLLSDVISLHHEPPFSSVSTPIPEA